MEINSIIPQISHATKTQRPSKQKPLFTLFLLTQLQLNSTNKTTPRVSRVITTHTHRVPFVMSAGVLKPPVGGLSRFEHHKQSNDFDSAFVSTNVCLYVYASSPPTFHPLYMHAIRSSKPKIQWNLHIAFVHTTQTNDFHSSTLNPCVYKIVVKNNAETFQIISCQPYCRHTRKFYIYNISFSSLSIPSTLAIVGWTLQPSSQKLHRLSLGEINHQ